MSDFLKGRNFVIVPRVTTLERNALTATNGMLVYDTTANAFYKYENGSWSAFAGGSASWGGITGTLSNQTDLQNALNAKQATLTASNFGSFLNGLTGKTTPVDADEVGIVDSEASNVTKKLTWANLKATLKTYFDTLYTKGSGFYSAGSVAAQTTGTVYGWVDGVGSFSTTENLRQNLCRGDSIISNAAVKIGAQPASGSFVATLRKNGVDTSVVVTVAAGSGAGTYEDNVNTATFANNDLMGWKYHNFAASATGTIFAVSCKFTMI